MLLKLVCQRGRHWYCSVTIKMEIMYFISYKKLSFLTWKYLPPAEKNTIGCRLYTYRTLSSIILFVIALSEMLHSYQCQICLIQKPSHRLLHSIPTHKMIQTNRFQNRRLSSVLMHSRPWFNGWWWAACIYQWIRFWWRRMQLQQCWISMLIFFLRIYLVLQSEEFVASEVEQIW